MQMQKKRSRASNKLNESEWKRIKAMLDAGFTCSQVANNRNVAWKFDTVKKISRSTSFADYQKKFTGLRKASSRQESFNFEGIPESGTIKSFMKANENKVMFCFTFKSRDYDAVMGHLHALDTLATHKMDRIVFNGEKVVRMVEELQNVR